MAALCARLTQTRATGHEKLRRIGTAHVCVCVRIVEESHLHIGSGHGTTAETATVAAWDTTQPVTTRVVRLQKKIRESVMTGRTKKRKKERP